MAFGNNHPVLQWQDIALEEIINDLMQLVDTTISNIPSENTRTISKMMRWKEMLTEILLGIRRIKGSLQPQLEKKFNVALNKRGLLTVSLFQPSTKNVFLEIQAHYADIHMELDEYQLNVLAGLSETAKVLGLLGDAVIDIAVLHHLWEPDAARVGDLTQRRSQAVSNEHLANICDKLGLYQHRIHFDPKTQEKSEIEHIKGTLVEALFGVIYIEQGFDAANNLAQILL